MAGTNANGSLPAELTVGAFRVRPAEGTLCSGGRRQRLEPKVAALLAYLVQHRDRMVSREELLDSVWAGVVVAPIALARAMSELRSALDDDAKAPRYIETYPKRGYRLVAAVDLAPPALEPEPAAAAGPTPPLPRRPLSAVAWALALQAAILTAASQVAHSRIGDSRHTVAVAPFRALDAETAAFAEALTDEVFDGLSRVDDVTVGPRGRVAEELMAGTVLEAAVSGNGGRLRVAARLTARPGGEELWSESYERDRTEGGASSRVIAARIVHGLRVHGLRARDTREARVRPPAEPSAPTPLDLFRHGRRLLARHDLEGAADAQVAFDRALAQEPGFTLARTGKVLALAMRTGLTSDPAPAREGVLEAERSVAADPGLPEAHHALGRAQLTLGRYRAAARANDEALRLRPDFLMALADRAMLWALRGELDRAFLAERDLLARDYPLWRARVRQRLGQLLLVLDRRAEARAWLEDALRAEPHDPEATVELARVDALDGDRAGARRRLEGLLAVEPSCRPCLVELGRIALREGDERSARRVLIRALDLPGDRAEALVPLVSAERRIGAPGQARARLAEAESDARDALAAGDESAERRLALAAVAALRGHAGASAEWCGQAVEAGWRDPVRVREDPAFRAILGNAGIEACLDRAEALASAALARLGKVPLPGS